MKQKIEALTRYGLYEGLPGLLGYRVGTPEMMKRENGEFLKRSDVLAAVEGEWSLALLDRVKINDLCTRISIYADHGNDSAILTTVEEIRAMVFPPTVQGDV